jgi:hypothetical protein
MAKHDTSMDSPAHTPGARKGEEFPKRQPEAGRTRDTRTSRDTTGINADKRRPIDPRMPEMPPA